MCGWTREAELSGCMLHATTLPPLRGLCGWSRGAKFRNQEFGGSEIWGVRKYEFHDQRKLTPGSDLHQLASTGDFNVEWF